MLCVLCVIIVSTLNAKLRNLPFFVTFAFPNQQLNTVKPILLTILTSCIILHSSCNVSAQTEQLQSYMDRFPQSQLCDVYKYCFQDRFGLEHLMSDSLAAVRYIEYELQNSNPDDWQCPLFHYPLLNGNYVRVDINYVRKGIVPMEILVSAMLQSVKGVEPVGIEQIESWKCEWGRIRESLLDVRPLPRNFAEDSHAIDSLLESGRYAMHHSPLYNKTYHQHYRIIRKDVFDRLLLPLIMSDPSDKRTNH